MTHKQVTGMSFGELYDAVEAGKQYYLGGLVLNIIADQLRTACETQSQVKRALQLGKITYIAPWYDKLDGTWANGVWCKCWYKDKTRPVYAKVISKHYMAYKTTTGATSDNAEPVSKELAQALEEATNAKVSTHC